MDLYYFIFIISNGDIMEWQWIMIYYDNIMDYIIYYGMSLSPIIISI